MKFFAFFFLKIFYAILNLQMTSLPHLYIGTLYQVVLLAIKATREEVILLFIKRTAGLIFAKVAKWYG